MNADPHPTETHPIAAGVAAAVLGAILFGAPATAQRGGSIDTTWTVLGGVLGFCVGVAASRGRWTR